MFKYALSKKDCYLYQYKDLLSLTNHLQSLYSIQRLTGGITDVSLIEPWLAIEKKEEHIPTIKLNELTIKDLKHNF